MCVKQTSVRSVFFCAYTHDWTKLLCIQANLKLLTRQSAQMLHM